MTIRTIANRMAAAVAVVAATLSVVSVLAVVFGAPAQLGWVAFYGLTVMLVAVGVIEG